MDKILNIGDEVLIFRYIRGWRKNQDYENFIRGKVLKSELSEDLSYHGSSIYVWNYTVLGEDNQEYFGNYGHPHFGNCFFMKQEDYIHCLERKIANNQMKILEINEENQKFKEMIEKVQIREEKEEVKKLLKKKDVGVI